MKKFNIVLSMLLAFVILFLSTSSFVAESALVNNENSKISEKLQKIIVETEDDNTVPIFIFLKSCDKSSVFENLRNNYGYDTEAYEDKAKYYSEIVPSIVVDDKTIGEWLNGEAVTRDVLNLDNSDSSLDINLRQRINSALVENSNNYLSSYRKEVTKVIDRYVSSFIENNKEYIDDIILKINCAEFIIASVKIKNIDMITKSEVVQDIDYYEKIEDKPAQWNAVSLTESDSSVGLGSSTYNGGSGYDGTGIKIGIIEALGGRYDPNNYNLVDADLTFVGTTGVSSPTISPHATNVTSLICGKKTTIGDHTYEGAAKNATIYQTAIYDYEDVCNALRMFSEMKVNVVNYSGGSDWGSGYNSYDRGVDYILATQRMCLVVAAGNEGNSGRVCSPGKAYNAITVGNLATKTNNVSLDSPFYIASSSSVVEPSYLANKPDVVAPGTSIYLPTSSTTASNVGGGTSYAAPIVTGIVAQIMQCDNFAIYNPNAAKNYIVCGASDLDLAGTTVSYGQLTDECGAGLVNAVNSYQCSDWHNEYYGVYLASNTAPTTYRTIKTFSFNRRDNIRITLTFKKEEDIPLSSQYGNNIDIRLISDEANPTYYIASESTNNNVELIDTQIPTTGTYLLQIRFTNSILDPNDNNDLHYWVSWRTY